MKILRGKWIAFLLLATRAALGSPAGGRPRGTAELSPASALAVATAPQAQVVQETGPAAVPAGLEAIQKAIAGVRSPGLQALARALGLSSAQVGQQAFEDSTLGLEAITGLEHGGISAVAVKWQPADQGGPPKAQPELYLLSWAGEGWQASLLMEATAALTLEVLPGQGGGAAPLFAVVLYRGVTAVPYPVIFRLKDHHASLVWDGRSDSASYTGYDFGSIEFEKAGSGNVPVMIAAGQADPGLLMFAASPEQTGRGFQAATAYVWKNDAYVPFRTEYTHNRDYVLYRFIAALHLHDYKTAYSFIDPPQFLKTEQPTLELFRQRIQNMWPEFIDDRIFEVPARPETDPESHTFILRLGEGRINAYHPTFTPGPDYRLTGLERVETRD
ncbi:MAG TPA: hypothetical protein VFQ24_16105 [Terriglobia bacterium]|nr:hypothetical protein [Terriglobia bacterium]